MNIQFIKQFNSRQLFLLSLFVFCISIPTSVFLISLAQFGLIISWLWKGNYSQSISKFLSNKSAVLITLIYALHIFGLLYTSNFSYASNDLRIKLPLLVIPFIIAGFEPIEKKTFDTLIWIFIVSTLVSTLISFSIYLGLSSIEITDIRQISILISHIRLSLMICLSIFACIIHIVKNKPKITTQILILCIISWFVFFLFLLESVTGIFVLIGTLTISAVYFSTHNSKFIYKISLLFFIIIIGFTGYFSVKKMYDSFTQIHAINLKQLELATLNGRPYKHNLLDNATENGYYVGIYQNWEECVSSWKLRSKLDPNYKDLKKQSLQHTMYRYLTSKGLRKDSVGISKLNRKDISNIEHGITNYKFANSGIQKRLNDIFYEYQNFRNNGDANGHSMYMRLIFWKTALHIIQNEPLLGVGEGDINDAFLKQYKKDSTKLHPNYQLRAHNQFLSITVAFGIIGLIAFCTILFYLIYYNKNSIYFLLFMTISILSFLNEDTLETSTGAVFFAFLGSFCSIQFNTKKLA